MMHIEQLQAKRSKTNMKRAFLLLALCLALVFLASTPARADDFTLTLNPSTQYGYPGTTVFFTATFTNNTASTVYLNGDDFNISLPGDASWLDDSAFWSNWPLTLDPGQSWTALLFCVLIPANAPYGANYYGYFALLGGADGNAQDVLASASWEILYPTPEPASLTLMGLGLLGVAGRQLRRLRRNRV